MNLPPLTRRPESRRQPSVPDQIHRRLEAREEQEQSRADELAGTKPVTLLLGRHEGGKQAVIGIGATFAH
jgi:hypothetical protein